MSKRNKILEILKMEELTAKELSEKTGISIKFVRVYLGQYIKDKKVIIVDPTKGWHKKYRAIEFKEFVRVLYDIMTTKMIAKENTTLTNEEIKNINIITRVLNIE